MKNEPLVSIVLPTYNGSRYLAQSIQSCIDQTYQNWELIIVDDCSKDDTPAIIDQYVRRDARISSIRHDKNRRLPGGLNTGFARSRGEYLTWTSDDNLYEPEALELMVHYLEGEPSAGVVYCDEQYIGPEGEHLRHYRKEGPDSLPRLNVVNACFLYRRAVHETVGGYDPAMVLVEDYEYWLRASRHFRIAHLPGVAPYRYRWHTQSLTCTRTGDIKVQMIRAQGRHLALPTQRRRYMVDALWRAHWDFRLEGNISAAWRCVLACWKLAPWRFRTVKALVGTALTSWTCGDRPDAKFLSIRPEGEEYAKGVPSSTTPHATGSKELSKSTP